MNKTSVSIIIGVLVSIGVLVGITVVYPIFDDLWVENPFWNGLSAFYNTYHPVRMEYYIELDALYNPGNSTLFIIGPYKEFTEGEVSSISRYIGRGGTLVLADDFGTGNNVLESLGMEVRFDSELLSDPIFREKNKFMPRASASLPGLGYIVLNYPTVLRGVDEGFVSVWSSPLSHISEQGISSSMLYDSYPIMASIPVSSGKVVVLSDSSVFINSMLEMGDNQELLGSLARGTIVIDEAHSAHSRLVVVKSFLSKIDSYLGFYEIRYALVLMVLLGVLRVDLSISEGLVDPVDELMERYPEYDRNQLIWLEKERRKAQGEE
jgi:hypothetical protein